MLGALGRLVAPDIPPVQDLQHHWSSFLDYYSQRPVAQLKAEPVERTNLAFHINKILALLVAEQENSSGDLSPCLEYVLHHDILNILVTLCQADTPPGIRPYIFKVFIFIVEKVDYPLLPETSCHLALCRLTLVCSLTKASPTESQEVEFLSMLCRKIDKDPCLIQVFLPEDDGPTPESLSSRSSSRASSTLDLDQIGTLAINVKHVLENVKSRHYLGSALLNYMDSPDYMLTCTVQANLLHLAGLKNETSAQALVSGSSFLPVICSRVIDLAKAVPESISAQQMEELQVGWTTAHRLYRKGLRNEEFPGRTELIAYLGFLNYVDELVEQAHPLVAEALADCLTQGFFATVLQSSIGRGAGQEATKEAGLIFGLSFLAASWAHVRSDRLAAALASWFRGHSRVEDDHEEERQSSPLLWILALWEREGDLGLESMRLFDTLLVNPTESLLDGLVTSFVESRGYYRSEPTEAEAASWSDIEDERERSRPLLSSSPPSQNSAISWRSSRTLAPANIHRVVNLWLSLVSEELRLDELRGSGYDMYVKDATRQVEAVQGQCLKFGWPLEALTQISQAETSSTDSRSESDPGRHFSCGPLLEALLDKVEKILDSGYETNLQLTSILSKLCQLPHPYLHEYLMNPTVPLQEGARTLYTTLRSVLLRASQRTASIEHFPRKMRIARRKLLGDQLNSNSSEIFHNQPEEERLFEAIVVVDEFCKELAAISLVKYHLYSG